MRSKRCALQNQGITLNFFLFFFFVVVAVVVCLLRVRYSLFMVVPSSSCRFPGTHANSD